MQKIDREDIQIIARHSNLSEQSIHQLLKSNIYSNNKSWYSFLKLFFISLGVVFTTAGIIFFFAYNWVDLNKFVKIGLIQGLIIAIAAVVLFSKLSLDIKNILFTAVSILVGVLFAVFGQIYQTGANAYDFFLGWTMAIAMWVVISNYPPLWVVFIVLINTTVLLYAEQVARDWSGVFICTLLFSINVLFLIFFLIAKKLNNSLNAPNWFTSIIALATTSYSTIGISMGIFEKDRMFLILVTLTIVCYGLGIKYALKERLGFYLAIIPFSIIIIISTLFIKISDDASTFFLISLFIIASVTLVIKNLINLQKKWTN